MSIVMLVVATVPMRAQWNAWGVSVGGGVSYASDDLFRNAPVLAVEGVLYADYHLRQRNLVAQHLVLRTGLGVWQQGTRFEMEFPYAASKREGRYELRGVLVPAEAGWRFPLDGENGDDVVLVWTGALLRLALDGRLEDRQSSDRYDSPLVNFDRTEEGAAVFDGFRRCDAALTVGGTLRKGKLTFSLSYEWGLVPQRRREEALIFVDVEPGEPPTGWYATQRAVLLSIGYRAGIKHQKRKANANAVFM